jgi:two-component system response regulator HydG
VKRVLVVDDDRATCNLLQMGLSREGFDTQTTTGGERALQLLAQQDFDLVMTDLNMPSMSGLELCERVVAARPEVPVIVITAFGNMDVAIAAMRAGAFDFVTKPFEMDAMVLSLERAIRHHELREEVKRLRAAVGSAAAFPGLVGASAAMGRLHPLLDRFARSDASILITGESGTGKEVVARALHERSARGSGPFVAINCAALPEALLESELFGHVRGAFTDAKTSNAGLILGAHGGTLFLDEIGELPRGLQPKFLRVLEQRAVRPVGGGTEVAVDFRLIAATNRDLETMIEDGLFREDLFYRIAVITFGLPPLRARENDVLLLAQHFVDELAPSLGRPVTGLSRAAAAKLLAYPWPGNVRELRNCIERALVVTSHDRIVPDDLPEKVRDYQVVSERRGQVERPGAMVPLEEIERQYILRVLEAVGGNKSLAAETLGLNRKTLYRKLAAWGVE